MESAKEPANLEQMLDRLERGVGDDERVTIKTMLGAAGSRSFAPALLLAGLIMFSPLSGIPGLPSVAALLVLLIAGQMLLGRRYFWLPSFIESRSVSRRKFEVMLRWLNPMARFIDRFLKPRLTRLTQGPGTIVLTLLCMIVALSVPPLEIFPFLASTAGAILMLLSLSMIANDGVMALLAMVLVVGLLSGVVVQLA